MLDHPLMAVVDRASRAVGAMRLGRVVERPAIFGNPQHPCIKQLLAAVPVADPRRRTTEEDRNCKPIPSPAFPVDHEPVPSVHDDVRPGHLVLKHDLGRFKHG